jgi:hypothetical protein
VAGEQNLSTRLGWRTVIELQGLKATLRRSWPECRPSRHRSRDTLEVLRSEILKLKQSAGQLSLALGDIWLGDTLQPSRKRANVAQLPPSSAKWPAVCTLKQFD